jgi:DNA-binding response OmpR family regulator
VTPPRPRILAADDDAGIRDLLRTYLAGAGLQVHLARDGVEAVELFHQAPPDLLILDINMPRKDGFSTLETLRPRLQAHRTPVLMLSARHAEEDVRRAVTLGAKDFLTKPFNRTQLFRRVARLLRQPGASAPGDVQEA